MHDPGFNSPVKTGELENTGNKEDTNSSIKTDEFSPVKTDEIIDLLPFNFPAIDAFPANDFRSIGFTHHSEILMQCKDRKEPAIIFFAVRGATIPLSDFLFARRKTAFRHNTPLNQVVSR